MASVDRPDLVVLNSAQPLWFHSAYNLAADPAGRGGLCVLGLLEGSTIRCSVSVNRSISQLMRCANSR